MDAEEGTADKTHLIMGWKLGESADLTAMLEAQLVSSVLMENSASPLMHYLETTDRGSAPSPLCGLEDPCARWCSVVVLKGVTQTGRSLRIRGVATIEKWPTTGGR
ncbi:MAG: hypothetical protein CM15mP74_04830 [Halieaceae bacterium]|nr:MAG: hypothetical protein CM15mP74_04830 [Halieaceae bacterium]